MSVQYLPIEEASTRTGEEKFFENVRKRILPRMVEKGVLNGKQEGER